MVDFITTDGRLVMSADEESAAVHYKGDVITFEEGPAYVVIQRTWRYERAGLEIVNPLDPNKRTANVKPRMQIVLQEVNVNAG